MSVCNTSSFVTNISVGPGGRQPVASGWKTCDRSVIGVGVGKGVDAAVGVTVETGVGDGGVAEGCGGAVVVGPTAAGAEQPVIVTTSSAAMTKRMRRGYE